MSFDYRGDLVDRPLTIWSVCITCKCKRRTLRCTTAVL